MIDYQGFNPEELKIKVSRVNDVCSKYYRGSCIEVIHLPTLITVKQCGILPQKELLADCLTKLKLKLGMNYDL